MQAWHPLKSSAQGPAFCRTDARVFGFPDICFFFTSFSLLIRSPQKRGEKNSRSSQSPWKGDQLRPPHGSTRMPLPYPFVPRPSHLALVRKNSGLGSNGQRSTTRRVLPLARQNVNAESFCARFCNHFRNSTTQKIPRRLSRTDKI